jgi:transposase
MNIETWAYIRHLFFVQKLPKKVIARKLGLDPKTVRRALRKESFEKTPSSPRPSKLDDFKNTIDEMLSAYPTISAVRIYENIARNGYCGGITILRDYLRSIRKTDKPFLVITTLPAEQAQVDWGSVGAIIAGSAQKISCFLMVLSFSRMLYLEFFPSQSLENFMAAHVRAFQFFNGVAHSIRYDNLKSVVLTRFGSSIQFNSRFLDFAAHYLFTPSVCNLRSPHEKGAVENGIRYVKQNFLPARTFLSLADCNRQARAWRDQTANCRIHGTTKQRPIDLFTEKEKTALTPLPHHPYDTRILRAVKSSSQSLVAFETNRYSVPFAFASKSLTLKADEHLVSLYDKDNLIAQHPRCPEKHRLIENRQHYQGLLPARPKALFFKHRDLILSLGDTAQRYFQALTTTNLAVPHHLEKIIRLIELYGKTEVLGAMNHALSYQAFGHDYLLNIILAKRRKRSQPQAPALPSSKVDPLLIGSTWVEERDLSLYDNHFSQEQDSDDHDQNRNH